jgi:hypothetical protein
MTIALLVASALLMWMCFLVVSSSWPWWLTLGFAAAMMYGCNLWLEAESRRERLKYAVEQRKLRHGVRSSNHDRRMQDADINTEGY